MFVIIILCVVLFFGIYLFVRIVSMKHQQMPKQDTIEEYDYSTKTTSWDKPVVPIENGCDAQRVIRYTIGDRAAFQCQCGAVVNSTECSEIVRIRYYFESNDQSVHKVITLCKKHSQLNPTLAAKTWYH